MPEVHEQRRDRLRPVLDELDVDALLVTRLVNVRYLTGFTGSNAALLLMRGGPGGGGRGGGSPSGGGPSGHGPAKDGALFATDGRYVAQAAHEVPDLEPVVARAVAVPLAERAPGTRLAVEAHDVTLELHRALTQAYDGELVPADRPVEALRVRKDDEELRLLREACATSLTALAELLPHIAVGRTERDLARELESRMLDLGAEAPAFATIVAGGPHSAVPHHRPTDRPLERGDLLKIDFGARVAGYHADCTRTYVVAAEPAPWQREIHDVVARAQRAGREALAVGADLRELDRAAREVVEQAGYGERFVHGLGHGVGLEVHEAPMVGYASAGRLADRTALTVEPGVYLEGRGGVRIEDTLVVGSPLVAGETGAGGSGGTELLTPAPRELLVVG